MSYNGSGTFLINSAGQPVVANTVISATVFNALTADLATGLSTAITKDGQTTVTANIPFGNNKITTLGAGTAATDAANLGQVQSTAAKLITVTGTDTITGSMSPQLTAYAAGQLLYFIANAANTGAVTINVDGLGAKAITRDGSTALAAGDINSGEVVVIVYDGTRFQMINAANSFGNTTINGTLTVTGNTGLQANVSITSALSVGGTFNVTGAATLGSTLSVTGKSDLPTVSTASINAAVALITTGTVTNLTATGASIASANIGNLQFTAASIASINAGVAVVTNLTATSASIASANVGTAVITTGTVTNFTSTSASIASANAAVALVTTGTVTNLTSTSASIASANLGTAVVTGLTVTGASIASVNVGAAVLSGNLTFSSTGQRITGDFSNATFANRLMFQTSTTNANTAVESIPNGTGTATRWTAYNNSDPTNASFFQFGITGTTAAVLNSGIRGTGTYVPITFETSGSERMRLDTSGNLLVGTTTQRSRITVVNSGYSVLTLGTSSSSSARGGAINFESESPSTRGQILYDTASDFMSFSTATAERMRLDASGNLGIGVTPTYKLDVVSETADVARFTVLDKTLDSIGNVQVFTSDTQAVNKGGSIALGGKNGLGGVFDPWAFGVIKGAKENSTSSNLAGYLAFATANSGGTVAERMRIDSTGNVGIGGTAGALEKFRIAGTFPSSANYSVGCRINGTIPSASTGGAYLVGTVAGTQAASFNVGEIRHFNAEQGTFGAGSSVANQYGFLADSTLTGATNNFGFYSAIASGSNRWNFYAAGTAQNYFAGNTGVGGVPGATTRLYAKGIGTTNANYTIYFENSGATPLLYILDDGVFSTGTAASSPYNNTTANAANVEVDASGILRRSTSSLRYKSNVADATHGLADVLKLRSVTYKGKNDGDKVFGGLIAEEVHDAGLTEFVAYDKEGRPDALHYGNMVALLVKAVQELKAELEALKAA